MSMAMHALNTTVPTYTHTMLLSLGRHLVQNLIHAYYVPVVHTLWFCVEKTIIIWGHYSRLKDNGHAICNYMFLTQLQRSTIASLMLLMEIVI
ncbi:hypothetical protein LINPERHAP2_LOCUS14792 [Linum perenne]